MLLGFSFSYRDSIILCNFSFQLLCVCVCVWKELQRKPSRKVVSPLILDRIKVVFLLNITISQFPKLKSGFSLTAFLFADLFSC